MPDEEGRSAARPWEAELPIVFSIAPPSTPPVPHITRYLQVFIECETAEKASALVTAAGRSGVCTKAKLLSEFFESQASTVHVPIS